MSEMKHTPGEWFTHREGFSTVYVECRIGGGLIQEVAACGPTAAGSEQQEANARLIASAPDLLEALQVLSERIAYYASLAEGEAPNIEQWAYTEGSSDVAKARAAIAKATGQT